MPISARKSDVTISGDNFLLLMEFSAIAAELVRTLSKDDPVSRPKVMDIVEYAARIGIDEGAVK